MGGISNDASYSIAVDDSGNVYTAGSYDGTADFDPGIGVSNLISSGDKDIFIQKTDATGDLIWVKSMGGSGWDQAYSIAIDKSGYIYATGFFSGTADFDPGSGTANLSSEGGFDIFVQKLNSSGDLIWAKQIGGTGSDEGKSIIADASGNVYLTGRFKGTVDFDPGSGTSDISSAGGFDIFIQKLDASGNLAWINNMGGVNNDDCYSIAIDNLDNIYTTGYFEGTVDFDPGPSVMVFTSAGGQDIFIQKLNSSGSLIWTKQIGGTGLEQGYSIAVNDSGNIYSTGLFYGTVDFDPENGIANLTAKGGSDVFLQKLNSSGNLVWAKQMGGTGIDIGNSIAVDDLGNAFITGIFYGTADFDPNAGIYNLSSSGLSDIFVQKLNSSGNFIWAKQMGGTGVDMGNSINIDNLGNTYSTGSFSGTADFDPDTGILNLSSYGNSDIYILKSSICDTHNVPICLVSVDLTSKMNYVEWKKPITTKIDSFLIYREFSSNSFRQVGNVHYDDISEFYDDSTTADPNIKPYKYKLAVLDSCGNISGLSEIHKTIYLITALDSNNEPYLQWTDYEGFPFTDYRILSDSNSSNNWIEIATVPFGVNLYSDPNLPIKPNAKYIVEVLPSNICSSNNARSNSTSLYITNINNLKPDVNVLSIYPNPFSNSTSVMFKNDDNEKFYMAIYNILGKKVLSKENITSNKIIIEKGNLMPGVYYIELSSPYKRYMAEVMVH